MNRLRILTGFLLFLLFVQHGNIARASTETINRILQKGIEVNFSGDYDRASEIFASIETIDPDHPAQAFYQAVVLFWRNSLDAANPQYVDQIRQYLQRAGEQAEKMLAADEDNIEALHYLGIVYTYLGRLEAHNGRLYKGGVLGEQGRSYLEQAIAICEKKDATENQPGVAFGNPCEDLYFPYGAYSYFAGHLPRFLQMVSFLWFVPSGSTQEGLKSLERARENSGLHRLGAESLLVAIALNFEADRRQTVQTLSKELIARFPDNPYLEIQHARLLLAEGMIPDAFGLSERILGKVDRGIRNYNEVVRQAALLVQAEAWIRQAKPDSARKILTRLEKETAYQNNSLRPCTDLLLGMLADIEKQRESATGYYKQVRSYKGAMQNRMAARKAEQYLQTPFTGSLMDASS